MNEESITKLAAQKLQEAITDQENESEAETLIAELASLQSAEGAFSPSTIARRREIASRLRVLDKLRGVDPGETFL